METHSLLHHCIAAVQLLKAQRKEIEHKGEAVYRGEDTVLADKRAEDLILSYLQNQQIPGRIVSEELSKEGKTISIGDKYLIAVDPYDGSTNFKRKTRLPYGTLVAIFSSTKPTYEDALAAAVISLTEEDLWYAERGKGCFYRGKASEGKEVKCSVSKQTTLCRESFLFWDFSYSDAGSLRAKIPNCYVRNIGSASIEFALVAGGNADARVSTCQKAHELGAGNFLIEEAGGIGITLDGKSIRTLPYNFDEVVPCIHAGTKEMAYTLLEKIKS